MSITGEPDRPPVRCGSSIVDLHASLALVTAILAALFHRERTGEGQVVETSLLRSSAHLVNYFYGEYWSLGVIRKPMGTANHLSVPNQLFPAADGSVVIIAPSDEMWARCAIALDARETRSSRVDDDPRPAAAPREVIEAITRGHAHADERGTGRTAGRGEGQRGQAQQHRRGGRPSAAREHRRRARIRRWTARPSRRWRRRSRCEARRSSADRPPPGSPSTPTKSWRSSGFADAEVAALRADGAFGKPRAPRAAARDRAPTMTSGERCMQLRTHQARRRRLRRDGHARIGRPSTRSIASSAARSSTPSMRCTTATTCASSCSPPGQDVLRGRRHQGARAAHGRAGRVRPRSTGSCARVFYSVMECSKPVIAAVNGHALGAGFALTLCCDILLAADDAIFACRKSTSGSPAASSSCSGTSRRRRRGAC